MHVNRNKLLLFSIVIVIVGFLTACQTSSDSKETFQHLEPNIISIEEDAKTNILDVTFYDSFAYLVKEDSIVTYDLASEKRTVLVDTTGNKVICADKGNIYTYNNEQNAVIKYSKSGDVIETYPFSFDPIDAKRIVKYNKTIIIVSEYVNNIGNSESELYKFDLSTATFNKITDKFKGNDSYSRIISIDFVDEDTIMISSYAVISMMYDLVKGYQFDLQSEKVIEEFTLPLSSSACSYDAKSKGFYYSEGGAIKTYDAKSSAEVTLSKIDFTALGSKENDYNHIFIKKLFKYNTNIIMWNDVTNLLIIEDLPSDTESINIILSDSVREFINISPLIDQFEETYGCNVRLTEYSKDVFNEKLRVKLLASESDFDICFINYPTEDNLLASILNYDLYEPLDHYDSIVNNFSKMYSGIPSMMSYHDKLYGVPYNIDIDSQMALNCNFRQYGYTVPNKNLSTSDVWKLCDEIIQSGEENVSVFFDLFAIIPLIRTYVQDAIINKDLDKEVLTELLENIKTYNDAGVLFDPVYTEYSSNYENNMKAGVEPDPSSYKNHLIVNSQSYFLGLIRSFEVIDYPKYGTVVFPTINDKVYHYLEGLTMINKFSKNNEMAAKFIEMMTNSENIYNTDIYRNVLLGPDLTKYNVYNDWSPTVLSYLSEVPSLYANAGVYTNEYLPLLEYFVYNIMFQFLDGSLSVEDAVNMIYEKVNYLYFE